MSVDEVSSPEKNDAKISISSVVCFLCAGVDFSAVLLLLGCWIDPPPWITKEPRRNRHQCFYGTFCETMSRPKIFPFQLKLGVNECHFGLPHLCAVIHLTLSMRIVTSEFLLYRMHIDKENWIIVSNYGKPKWQSFSPSLSWKGNILGPDIGPVA